MKQKRTGRRLWTSCPLIWYVYTICAHACRSGPNTYASHTTKHTTLCTSQPTLHWTCQWTVCAQYRLVSLSFLSLKHLLALQDIVETHLLRDIAARSENFFQAASVVQELRGVLARTYVQVKTLRQEVESRLLCTTSCIQLRCDCVRHDMPTWSLS